MTKIDGTSREAINELDNFPRIKEIIDVQKFLKRVAEKYPNGAEVNDGEVTDLYTALLASRYPIYAQKGNNAATPFGALDNINDCIDIISMSLVEKKKLGDKLLNLKSSSMWDTLSELLLARMLIQTTLPNSNVVVEYPLGMGTKQNSSKDADVAILNSQGKPLLLIDAVTPQMSAIHCSKALDQIVDWIEKKYDSKFSAYCLANPDIKVAIVVCLLKNEHLYMGIPTKLIPPHNPVELPSTTFQIRPGLFLAYGSSFRCIDGKNLLIDHLVKFIKT